MGKSKRKKKKVKSSNDIGPLGFNFKDALIGNMERGHPQKLQNLIKSDKELQNRFRNTILGG